MEGARLGVIWCHYSVQTQKGRVTNMLLYVRKKGVSNEMFDGESCGCIASMLEMLELGLR